MDRRANVLLLSIKGFNNSEIATKLSIDRGTVKSDLNLLIDDQIDWTTNLALIGWMKKVEEIYLETNTAITNLTELQAEIKDRTNFDKFTFPVNPFNPDTQTKDYHIYTAYQAKVMSSYYTRRNEYTEYAHLENAKTKAKELLIGLTTHIPLFAATQRLAIYYSQNEQQKQDIKENPSLTSKSNILKKS